MITSVAGSVVTATFGAVILADKGNDDLTYASNRTTGETMNFLISILALVTIVSTNAFAQYNDTEISGKLGMSAGAVNLGADYVNLKGDYGFGGYVFIQSSRDRAGSPVVNGITALGGMLKLILVEKSSIKAYIAPGVGITMVKDGSVNGLGRRSDETVIGTTLKIGVQIIRDRNFSIGIEQMQLSNWLNDNLNSFAGPGEYYSVVGSWTY